MNNGHTCASVGVGINRLNTICRVRNAHQPLLIPPYCSRSILLRRCICTTRVESRDSQMESTKTIALAIHSVDHPSLFPY